MKAYYKISKIISYLLARQNINKKFKKKGSEK